jgi:hypothetical protein
VERDVGLRYDIAGCDQERDEHRRGETAKDQRPAIE